jgi:hypothetical protein
VLSGSDAFSRVLRRSLRAVGRRPSDLLFANARDPTGALDLEVGVFRVRGLSAAALRDAIVRGSRPNAPGLAVSHVVLGGVPVTRLVYPGGSTLCLDANHGVVYDVGTQNAALAARLVRRVR